MFQLPTPYPAARSQRSLPAVGLFLAAMVAVLLAGCDAGPSTAAADDDFYEDWWLCAANCVPGSVGEVACLDACTDDFNETHGSPQREDPRPFKLTRGSGGGTRPTGFVDRCPTGTALSPFPMPIYDQSALFVTGFRTVWYCLPEDLEPAG